MADWPNLNGSSIICPECAGTKKLRSCYPCMLHSGIDQNSYLSFPKGDFLYASALSGDEIRLIEFHGSRDDDDIRCSLVVRHLDDSLVYNALSYCWASQNSKCAITCNSSHLEVGHNLYMAMRQIRRDNRTELLWADALCINQADNAEKATQVKMMRKIYQRAKLVIAWLGEEENLDHLAFQLMDLLNDRFQLRWAIEDQRVKKKCHFSREELGLPNTYHPSWKALCGFLTRPFFFRVWIIQEILAAKECIFQFGEYRVDRKVILGIGACMEEFSTIDDIITLNTPVNGSWEDDSPIEITNSVRPASFTPPAVHNLALHDVLTLSVYSVKSLWRIRSIMSSGQRPSIIQLLSETKMFQATIPHDKIFALVGLASDLDPDFLDKFIDYDKPLVDIQIELAKVCMEHQLSWGPALFSYVDAQCQSNELPSWVPDWTRGGPTQRSLCDGFCHQNTGRQIKWQLDSNNVSCP